MEKKNLVLFFGIFYLLGFAYRYSMKINNTETKIWLLFGVFLTFTYFLNYKE